MPEILPVSPAEAARRMRGNGRPARGFLGLDPVVHNDELIIRRLGERETVVLVHGDTLLGARPNPDNPRQAVVASTSGDVGALAALVEFLRVYRRHDSLLALTGPDEPARPALEALGFTETGVLRDHYFRAGAHHDARLHHLPLEKRP